MPEYRFTFTQEGRKSAVKPDSGTNVKSGNPSPTSEPPTNDSKTNERVLGFGKRFAENSVERAVISPLNSMTGGLASPVYGLGKAIASGAAGAAVGGAIAGVVMAGIQLAITKIQERVAKLETQADAANERDNILIRAGAKTEATFYEADFFRGVYKTNRN